MSTSVSTSFPSKLPGFPVCRRQVAGKLPEFLAGCRSQDVGTWAGAARPPQGRVKVACTLAQAKSPYHSKHKGATRPERRTGPVQAPLSSAVVCSSYLAGSSSPLIRSTPVTQFSSPFKLHVLFARQDPCAWGLWVDLGDSRPPSLSVAISARPFPGRSNPSYIVWGPVKTTIA